MQEIRRNSLFIWADSFTLLQASLGLTVSGTTPYVHFRDSYLPPVVDQILVENLRVGKAKVSFIVRRKTHGIGIDVIRREGEVEVAVLK
jgi:hypothetical protein